MPISSAGLGSGLDVASIVAQLVAIESQPLVTLQNKKIQYEAEVSAFGQLRSSVSDFQAAMEKLNTISSLDVYSTSSTNEDVITATASGDAEIGSFGIEVVRLAENHKMASSEALDTATFGGTVGDSVTVQVGSDPLDVVTIDLTTAQSLSAIRDAINADVDNPGVTATIINGDGGNQKLVLTSEDSGEARALTVSYGGAVDLGFLTLNDIGGDLSLLDSEVNVDGYNVTRPTNKIDDVINGVTLNLASADPGNTHTVDVERNFGAVTELVQSFADAYDALRAEIKVQRSGQLGSDSTLLSLDRQLSSILNTAATGGEFSYLTEVGVTIQKDGTMSLDTTQLDVVLQSNFDDVAQLFAADEDGYANRFYSLAESWLASDGVFDTRTDGLNDRIDDLDDKAISVQRSIELIEARYRSQFSALDTLVAQLRATGDYLTTQLESLPGFNSSNR